MTTTSNTPAIPDVLIDDANLREILLALKTIAEIREGRHIDKDQRFISYCELVEYLRGTDRLVVEATTIGHNHNDLYSLLGHNHNALYSILGHNHNNLYALLIHGHDGLYSVLSHRHDELYSLLSHNHNLIDLAEKAYSSLTGKPTIPSAHSDLTDDEAVKHRLINDAATSLTELWSSTKIADAISGANPVHDHDSLYAVIMHGHDGLYALLTHNHNLIDLAEKSYNSLSDKPAIPAKHSDLTDDEQTKHRLINDSGTSVTELWSANKIDSAIAAGGGSGDMDQAYFMATM